MWHAGSSAVIASKESRETGCPVSQDSPCRRYLLPAHHISINLPHFLGAVLLFWSIDQVEDVGAIQITSTL